MQGRLSRVTGRYNHNQDCPGKFGTVGKPRHRTHQDYLNFLHKIKHFKIYILFIYKGILLQYIPRVMY